MGKNESETLLIKSSEAKRGWICLWSLPYKLIWRDMEKERDCKSVIGRLEFNEMREWIVDWRPQTNISAEKRLCMVDVSTTYRTYRVNFCTDIDVTFIWRLHRYTDRQIDRQTDMYTTTTEIIITNYMKEIVRNEWCIMTSEQLVQNCRWMRIQLASERIWYSARTKNVYLQRSVVFTITRQPSIASILIYDREYYLYREMEILFQYFSNIFYAYFFFFPFRINNNDYILFATVKK